MPEQRLVDLDSTEHVLSGRPARHDSPASDQRNTCEKMSNDPEKPPEYPSIPSGKGLRNCRIDKMDHGPSKPVRRLRQLSKQLIHGQDGKLNPQALKTSTWLKGTRNHADNLNPAQINSTPKVI